MNPRVALEALANALQAMYDDAVLGDTADAVRGVDDSPIAAQHLLLALAALAQATAQVRLAALHCGSDH